METQVRIPGSSGNNKHALKFELQRQTGSKKNVTSSCLIWECKSSNLLRRMGVENVCYKKYDKIQKSLQTDGNYKRSYQNGYYQIFKEGKHKTDLQQLLELSDGQSVVRGEVTLKFMDINPNCDFKKVRDFDQPDNLAKARYLKYNKKA